MVYNGLTELIGNTPMVRLGGFDGLKAEVILKLEYFNPGGSAKDISALSATDTRHRMIN